MPSNISDEERRLIDEAVAEDRVTKVARGQSAFQYKWDEDLSRLVFDKEKSTGNLTWNGGHHKVTQEVIRRRAFIKAYHEEGLTNSQMQRRFLDEGYSTTLEAIRYDLKKLGLEQHSHVEAINSQRLETFWRLIDEGVHKYNDVAALMEMSSTAFANFLKRNNLSIKAALSAPASSRKSEQDK